MSEWNGTSEKAGCKSPYENPGRGCVVLGPPLFGALSGLFGTYRAGFLAVAVITGLCAIVLASGRRLLPPPDAA